METLRREEKTEKRNEPSFSTDLTKTAIAFPVNSDGLGYSELLNSVKSGGVRPLVHN